LCVPLSLYPAILAKSSPRQAGHKGKWIGEGGRDHPSGALSTFLPALAWAKLAIMATQQNSLPELVELLLRTVCNEAGEWDVRVDLRINSGDLDCSDGTAFNVSFKRAWLKLDRSGIDIVPGSRHGEPTKPNVVTIKQKTSSESVVESQADAHAELSAHASASKTQAGLDAKAGASAKHNVKGKTTVPATASESTSHLRVKVRPAEQWEVSESQGRRADRSSHIIYSKKHFSQSIQNSRSECVC
jgi:hypothetical protein